MEKSLVWSLSNKPVYMEPNQIKEAHILDILFDGRNKEYGAYELRKTYNQRITKAMIVMVSMVVLVLLGGVVSGLGKAKGVARIDIGDSVNLQGVVDPPPVPPPPPKVVPPPSQVAFPSVASNAQSVHAPLVLLATAIVSLSAAHLWCVAQLCTTGNFK